jgi:hypothetical protein
MIEDGSIAFQPPLAWEKQRHSPKERCLVRAADFCRLMCCFRNPISQVHQLHSRLGVVGSNETFLKSDKVAEKSTGRHCWRLLLRLPRMASVCIASHVLGMLHAAAA